MLHSLSRIYSELLTGQGCFGVIRPVAGTLQTFAFRKMVSPFPKPFGHSIVFLSSYPHRDIDPVPFDQECALPLQVGSASYLPLLLSTGTCPLRVFAMDSRISQYVTQHRSLTISWHKSCRLRLESECTSPWMYRRSSISALPSSPT